MVTIGELIERNARYYPDAEAYIYQDKRITFGQYAERTRQLASGLYNLGVRRQERVAILAMNCPEYFEVYGAAEWAGYIAALVNFRLALPEVLGVLEDADPKILVFEAQYADMVSLIRERLSGIEHFVCIGDGPEWAVGYEELVNSGSPLGPPIRSRMEDFCHLFYTSGTTGKPKGVPHSHLSACHGAQRTSLHSEINGSSRVLQVTPAFHVGGKGYPLAALWTGGTIVLHRVFDPVDMLETIHKERITHTFMVAAMLQAVLDVPNVLSYDVSSMRNIISASAPIPVPLLKRGIDLLGQVFSVQYGMTESCGPVAVLPRHEVNPFGDEDAVRRLGSVGHVVPETPFRIVGDDGQECVPGEAGEVCIKSSYQPSSYWNNTLATLDVIKDGWYHTGDVGCLDAGGYLFLVDRKKDMIISGGENIYSREVENAVLQHPDVADVAVIGVPDPRWGEAVKAVVVLRSSATLDEAALIAYCRQQIASYKCPKNVEFVNELPRLATGKVDKVTLRNSHRSAA